MNIVKIKTKTGKEFERDYHKYDYDSLRRRYVPSWDEYQEALKKVSEYHKMTMILRLGHELGISPYALVNLKKCHLNTQKPRSIFIEIAKGVVRGKKRKAVTMRSRLLPLNDTLYSQLMMYVETHDAPYIIPNERFPMKPLTVQRVSQLYQKYDIKWTPHKARSFFRNQLKSQLIPKGMYSETEVRKIMGHQPRDSAERYDDLNFELAMLYVNEAFVKRM